MKKFAVEKLLKHIHILCISKASLAGYSLDMETLQKDSSSRPRSYLVSRPGLCT